MTATHATGAAALNAAVRARFRQHCRPRPRLSMSDWAEQTIVLPSSTTRQAGRLRLAVAPYLREVLDAISDPHTQRVTLIAPSQSAKTTFVICVVLYYAAQEPSPVLVVQPTIAMAEDFSKGRLTPTIDASPDLARLFAPARSRDSGNTILSKAYAGGQLDIAGANSPAGLASRPKRVVLYDEVDRYPEEAGNEGDPISIGEARTRSFQRTRKIVIVTSPTDEPEQDADGVWTGSRGWREYLRGTREVLEEACPACGAFQVLQFDRLTWDTDADGQVVRQSVRYPCASCGHAITEADRPAMRATARFRPTIDRADRSHRSFHVGGMSAAFALWDELAAEFLAKKNDPVTLKTFLNTALGVVWRDVRAENQRDVLASRARRYDGRDADAPIAFDVPRGAGILTAGVDVQHDRLEVSLWGWGVGQQSWLITHEIIHGDPTQPAVWQHLDEWRRLTWRHESGAKLPVAALAVDAGDGNTAQHVYRWTAARLGDQVFAIKGSNNPAAPLTPRQATKVKPGRLYVIGVNGLTERWNRRLNMPADAVGPGYVNLNHKATGEFVKQLLGMERVYNARARRRTWVARKNTRVEALDCANYALAALLLAFRDEQVAAAVARLDAAPAARLDAAPAAAADTPATVIPTAAAAPRGAARRGPRRGGWL